MDDEQNEEIKGIIDGEEGKAQPQVNDDDIDGTFFDLSGANIRFHPKSILELRPLTPEEQKQCKEEAIALISERRKYPIVIIGDGKFAAEAREKLMDLGFRANVVRSIEGLEAIIGRDDPLAAVIDEKEVNLREYNAFVRRNRIENPPIPVPVMAEDLSGYSLQKIAGAIDYIFKEAGAVDTQVNVTLIDSDDVTARQVADALAEKRIHATVFQSEKDARFRETAKVQEISLEKISIAEKQFIIQAATSQDYDTEDMLAMLKHIKSKSPINIMMFMNHARAQRQFGVEQYLIEQICRHSGNYERVRATADKAILARLGSTPEMQRQELKAITSRNALKYLLNSGSSEDLHKKFMNKAFGHGYREFLFEAIQNEYLTDDAFLDYITRVSVRHRLAMMHQSHAQMPASSALSEDEIAAVSKSIAEQIGATGRDAGKKLSSFIESRPSAMGLEAAAAYRKISLDKIVKSLGGKRKAAAIKKKIGASFKDVAEVYLRDECYGPKDISSIIREERRIQLPTKNHVFRVSIDTMGLGTVDAIVKIFDYMRTSQGNPASEAQKKRKMHEFSKEIMAADYYSRWGINKSVHFFFEEYAEFGAVMMRFWGEDDLWSRFDEIDRLIAYENEKQSAGAGYDSSLVAKLSRQKDGLLDKLIKKMAKVHAYGPDHESKSKARIADPAEDFGQRLKSQIFSRKKKGETHLLQPFEIMGSDEMQDRFRKLLSSLRVSCAHFAEYLQKAPSLSVRVAAKDTSLRNWFYSSSRLSEEIKSEDIKPIDYGSVRALPIQMDIGNAFLGISIQNDLDAFRHYTERSLMAYESAVSEYNRRLESVAKNIVREAAKQFSRHDLCRKGARKYLSGLASEVISRLEDIVSSEKGALSLKDGRIHPQAISAMEQACREYISSLKKKKGKRTGSYVDIDYIRMFARNAISFFKNAKAKKHYLGESRGSEEIKKKQGMFWEGMLAATAYTALRNLGVYVDRISDSFFGYLNENPYELAKDIGRIINEGSVKPLEMFLEEYKEKIGSKEGAYEYTPEGYKGIARMASDLKKASELYNALWEEATGKGYRQTVLFDAEMRDENGRK